MSHFLARILLIVLILFSGSAVSEPEKTQKWVPYTYLDEPDGTPVFIVVLEDINVACTNRPNPEECRRLWEKLPRQAVPIGSTEVTYLADLRNGKGLQRIRMSKESHCTIMQEPDDETPCHKYWWHFVRKKIVSDT